MVQPYLDRGYRGFSEQSLVFGSEAEVADAFGRLEAMGYTDVIVRNLSSDQSESLETIEGLGRVREQLGG